MSEPTAEQVLAALADELRRARAEVDRLADLVGRLVAAAASPVRAEALREAQVADALAQHLDALAEFAAAVAEGRAVDQTLRETPLADLAGRLSAALLASAPPPPAAVGGDLQLFD